MQDPLVCKLPEAETLSDASLGTAMACMVDWGLIFWGLIFTESSPSEAGELCQSVVTS